MQQYNENGVLQEYPEEVSVVKCSYCKKDFQQETVDQVPGFRDRSFNICPYCGSVLGSSMEIEYSNSKIPEK